MIRWIISILLTLILLLMIPRNLQAPELPKLTGLSVARFDARQKPISRGEEPKVEKRVMEVTGYTAGYESTGKHPWQKGYGITASGSKAQEWYTVAAPSDFPIGSRMYIPFFADKPNKGIFVVEDRGSAITDNRLDVFFGDPAKDKTAVKWALEFGRQKLEVWILK